MLVSRRAVLEGGLAMNVAGSAPIRFDAVGDGVADDTRALAQALTAAQPGGGVVTLAAGRIYRASDVAVPSGVTLFVEPGAQLRPARPGSRFLLEGRLLAPALTRIFLDGWQFAKSKLMNEVADVPVEWFGGRAIAGERIDCAAAFDYALEFCKATRARMILLDTGYYYVSRTIVIDGAVGIRGAGIQSSFLMGNIAAPATPIIDLRGTSATHVPDVAFDGFSVMAAEAGQCAGIRGRFFSHVRFAQVEVRNCSVGMDLADTCYSWRIDGCRFLANRHHLRLGSNANNILIHHSQFLRGQTGVTIYGPSNSISVTGESNFELIAGTPFGWQGAGTTVNRVSVCDSRFEKCTGAIGGRDGTVNAFSFERNYVENTNGDTEVFFALHGGDNVVIAQSYFERAKALLNAAAVRQLTVRDNVLVRVPQINGLTPSGGISRADGFTRSRAYNCGGVRGSDDVVSGTASE